MNIPSEKRPLTPNENLLLLMAGAFFAFILAAELLSNFTPAKLSFFFLLTFWILLIVLHELGHAIMSWLVGWEVLEVAIGMGRDLWRFEVQGTLFRIKIIPLGGHVIPLARGTEGYRWKSALVYAAGPGIEMLLLGFLVLVLGPSHVFGASTTVAWIAVKSLAIALIIGIFVNLVPLRTLEGQLTDGLGILKSLSLSDAQLRFATAVSEWHRAARCLNGGTIEGALHELRLARTRLPDEPFLQLKEAWLLGMCKRVPEAHQLLEEMGPPDQLPPLVRAEYYHTLALLSLDDPDEGPAWEAERSIRRALDIIPEANDYHITQAAIMLRHGNPDAGAEELIHAFQRSTSPEEDARCLAYLVLAARAAGDRECEQRMLAAFWQAEPQIHLRQLVADPSSR